MKNEELFRKYSAAKFQRDEALRELELVREERDAAIVLLSYMTAWHSKDGKRIIPFGDAWKASLEFLEKKNINIFK